MPLRPKKCCGKNVILTPINITINWDFIHRSLSVIPVNKGNQYEMAAKIAKTAPILST